MNILVTNDDGIEALGIKAMVESLKGKGNIYVVAPDTQKSACGHGISIDIPVMIKEVEFEGATKAWAVSGTPADCVKLGVTQLISEKVDMVFSGINHGGNLGTDILYSGTVSGAVEGLLLGFPSVAISLNDYYATDFSNCKKAVAKVCEYMIRKDLEPQTLLNVNIPKIREEEIKGIRITPLGIREYTESFRRYETPRGGSYYWYSGEPKNGGNLESDTDIAAIDNNYVSVTPVHYDLTNYRIIEEIKKWDGWNSP
ncbi:MAG: 5'/3'-nucleotidase SurE [Peptostreptococcales bacterium]